eukprot:TRINITY_DN4932_c0_g1_i1.p1 TRINITY_DN4932_c0_g1~~TRINITY_DN4932_c0_g1_i1.p1  ORF type:complete len:713 (-),score=183.12 TRINITY_DN4932_c0_g1_i1:223-2361(-)
MLLDVISIDHFNNIQPRNNSLFDPEDFEKELIKKPDSVIIEKDSESINYLSVKEAVGMLINMGFDASEAEKEYRFQLFNLNRTIKILTKRSEKRLQSAQMSDINTVQPLGGNEVRGFSIVYDNSTKYFTASLFQQKILSHMDNVRKQVKHEYGVLVIATALGKTIISILDLDEQYLKIQERFEDEEVENVAETSSEQIYPCNGDGKPLPFRVLFLVHSISIRDNAMKKFKQHFCSNRPGRHQFQKINFVAITNDTNKKQVSESNFVFCLHQSFGKLEKIPNFLRSITHVIIDEVHHMLAETFNRVFAKIKSLPLKYCVGMTATLTHRSDPKGRKLKQLFLHTIYVDLPWQVAKNAGAFPDCLYFEYRYTKSTLPYNEIIQKLKKSKSFEDRKLVFNAISRHFEQNIKDMCDDENSDEPFNEKTEKYKMIGGKRIAELLHTFLNSEYDAESILVFLPSIKQCDEFIRAARKLFFTKTIAAVHHKVSNVSNILKMFVSKQINILVSVDMISEGWDAPCVDLIVFGRITDSEIVFVQQLGRGLRKDLKNPEKKLIVLDLVLNLRRRWLRLSKELTFSDLLDNIFNFWTVIDLNYFKEMNNLQSHDGMNFNGTLTLSDSDEDNFDEGQIEEEDDSDVENSFLRDGDEIAEILWNDRELDTIEFDNEVQLMDTQSRIYIDDKNFEQIDDDINMENEKNDFEDFIDVENFIISEGLEN